MIILTKYLYVIKSLISSAQTSILCVGKVIFWACHLASTIELVTHTFLLVIIRQFVKPDILQVRIDLHQFRLIGERRDADESAEQRLTHKEENFLSESGKRCGAASTPDRQEALEGPRGTESIRTNRLADFHLP